MEIIKVHNIYKNYHLGETIIEALKGVDLSLETGDFTALIGASGSGKSTLLNLLGCLDRPDSGQIIIDNLDVTQLNEDQLDHLRNRKLGFIFQSFNLIPVLSAYENIELPLLIQNDINDKERKERVLEALNDVDILKFKDHKPDKLSGGQRQRAAIARCLVTHPSIILADEPTANLDSKTAHMVIDLLIDLNKKKKVTFLFCTHDEKLIGRVGRIIKIQDGLITS